MSEKYDTVIACDTDDMIELVMGPREHLACIVVDAKRGLEYNFAMHKEMKSDMRFVSGFIHPYDVLRCFITAPRIGRNRCQDTLRFRIGQSVGISSAEACSRITVLVINPGIQRAALRYTILLSGVISNS